ncbi:hypothetical protein [Leucobacter luti]|uniref:hypothetical protein n=1 Tax=Leucobacter luti TaxID=340320 RepID=UPI003D05D906
MTIIYNRDERRRARRAARVERCRFHVEWSEAVRGTAYGVPAWRWSLAGVHRTRWVAIAHAWWISVCGTEARVIDREETKHEG